jgi:hypothetical protein
LLQSIREQAKIQAECSSITDAQLAKTAQILSKIGINLGYIAERVISQCIAVLRQKGEIAFIKAKMLKAD